jgi:hypothetical protein
MESKKFEVGSCGYFNRRDLFKDLNLVKVTVIGVGTGLCVDNLKIEFESGNTGYCHASQLYTKQELLKMIDEL